MIARFFLKYKTTLLLASFLSIFSIYTTSYFTPLHPEIKELFGYSAVYFVSWEMYRLFSWAMLTHGSEFFFRALLMILLCVWYLEHKLWSKKAFFSFWIIHVFSVSMLFLFIYFGHIFLAASIFSALFHISDVGPSGWYIGCLWVIIALSDKRRKLLFFLIQIILILLIIYHAFKTSPEKMLIADFLHIIAFNIWYFGYICDLNS